MKINELVRPSFDCDSKFCHEDKMHCFSTSEVLPSGKVMTATWIEMHYFMTARPGFQLRPWYSVFVALLTSRTKKVGVVFPNLEFTLLPPNVEAK